MERKLKKPNKRSVLFGSFASILFVFAVGMSCVFMIKDKLERARAQAQDMRTLSWVQAVIPDVVADISTTDLIDVVDPIRLGTQRPASLFDATQDKQVAATAMKWAVENGYNGAIELALAVNRGGTIVGITVLTQNETRGFGDVIQSPESHWIRSFQGRSLKNPLRNLWQLRSNGGEIDGLSGATITANAVVTGVATALQYLESRELER
ncbi:MAG: RnfABCDGE type electron transport complex subunit G [Proteobacteria bacterium]|nr:RnfABCDGE type electron transport complex subunit G [Pseudomonadota bacterium]